MNMSKLVIKDTYQRFFSRPFAEKVIDRIESVTKECNKYVSNLQTEGKDRVSRMLFF